MKRFRAFLMTTHILAVFILTGGQASADAEKFNLDKDHTSVGFQVSYMILARVSGQFDDFEGSFVIDHDHPDKSRADIKIQTASVDTGLDWRDEDIRGPGLFNAALHPTMVFHSRSIEMGPDNTGHITGDLTLLGITKPVSLDLTMGPGEDENLPDGFRVTGHIKRSDFGMNAFIRPIGNVVTLLVCYNMAQCDAKVKDPDVGNTSRYNQ